MLTEAHKNPNTCIWMTEQALREIYLRPFEIAVKTARKTILYAQDDQADTLLSRTMRAADFVMASDSEMCIRDRCESERTETAYSPASSM